MASNRQDAATPGSAIRRSHHYPTASTTGTAGEHWSAILQYDASRRQSSVSHPPPGDSHDRIPKRMSVGDDLPPMPQEHVQSAGVYARPVGEKAATELSPAPGSDLTLARQVTPSALKGDNAVLVNRELQRLRERRPNEKRMKWRVLTGTMMLLVTAFSTYVLAQSIRAYLTFLPTPAWVQQVVGATPPADPLLRTLALVEVAAAGVATLGTLASGFYLRMTRRRTCGRTLIWLLAVLSTTINVALSLVNIALIVTWYKQYASRADDPLSRTRNVGQRCSGAWDMDILWSAATEPRSTTCTQDPAKTLHAFLIAGSVRLATFVVLCTLWLSCLAKYNATLRMEWTHNESIDESPEMHKLLDDERGLPAMPMWSEVAMPGGTCKEHDGNDVGSQRDSKRFSKGDDDTLVHMPEHHYESVEVAPPRLDRFHWQRGDPSQAHDREASVMANVSRRQGSGHVMDRLWAALWGSSHEQDQGGAFAPVAVHEEDQHQQLDVPAAQHPWHGKHGREGTKLGVRGWFRRSASGQASSGELGVDEEVAYEKYSTSGGGGSSAALDRRTSVTTQTSTQEDRTQQGRHAAARRVQQRGDPYTDGGDARASVQERIERRKLEQRQRIDFLASLGRTSVDAESDGHDAATRQPPLPLSSKRSSQSGTKDMLLRMPEPQQSHDDHDDGIDEMGDTVDEDAFWHAKGEHSSSFNESESNSAPIFVRQLGKLVRKMSAIESVGSGEQHSQRRPSRDASSASAGRLL